MPSRLAKNIHLTLDKRSNWEETVLAEKGLSAALAGITPELPYNIRLEKRDFCGFDENEGNLDA